MDTNKKRSNPEICRLPRRAHWIFYGGLAVYVGMSLGVNVYVCARFNRISPTAVAFETGILALVLSFHLPRVNRVRLTEPGIETWTFLGLRRFWRWRDIQRVRLFEARGSFHTRVLKIQADGFPRTLTADLEGFDEIVEAVRGRTDIPLSHPSRWDRIWWSKLEDGKTQFPN